MTLAYALISISSISKTRVAPPWILGGEPWSPARETGIGRRGDAVGEAGRRARGRLPTARIYAVPRRKRAQQVAHCLVLLGVRRRCAVGGTACGRGLEFMPPPRGDPRAADPAAPRPPLARTVALARRDHQLALLADAHAGDALVPALRGKGGVLVVRGGGVEWVRTGGGIAWARRPRAQEALAGAHAGVQHTAQQLPHLRASRCPVAHLDDLALPQHKLEGRIAVAGGLQRGGREQAGREAGVE